MDPALVSISDLSLQSSSWILSNMTQFIAVALSWGSSHLSNSPLLAHYDKLQRTLLQQYEALGINYRATPSKIKENTKKGGEEHDKLSNLLNDIQNL